MASPLVAIRLPEKIKAKAEQQATKLGHIKPNGEPNLSEYIRNLIINDRR